MADAQKTREARLYKRRQRSERAAAAYGDALSRASELLGDELALAQLDAIPEADRRADWEDMRNAQQRKVDRERLDIETLEHHAEELAGKPQTAKEKRERSRALEQARERRAEELAGSWEDTAAAHERNIKRLEERPEELREDDHEDQVEAERENLALHERALLALDEMFPAARKPEETKTT